MKLLNATLIHYFFLFYVYFPRTSWVVTNLFPVIILMHYTIHGAVGGLAAFVSMVLVGAGLDIVDAIADFFTPKVYYITKTITRQPITVQETHIHQSDSEDEGPEPDPDMDPNNLRRKAAERSRSEADREEVDLEQSKGDG